MRRRDVLLCALALGAGGVIRSPAIHAASRKEKNPSGRLAFPPAPPAYVDIAGQYGIPPLVLYGVALQESVLLRGGRALPYPWTLNIQKSPRFLSSYAEAVSTLQAALQRGVRNVDCGLMQVNWGYHADKLGSPAQALQPYANLRVGAALLQSHYRETKDWFVAVGRYHAPADPVRAKDYAAKVYRRMAQVRHA